MYVRMLLTVLGKYVRMLLTVLGVGMIVSCQFTQVKSPESRHEESRVHHSPIERFTSAKKRQFGQWLMRLLINAASERKQLEDQKYGQGNYQGDIQLTEEQIKILPAMKNTKVVQGRKSRKLATIWPGKTVYYEPIPADPGLVYPSRSPFCVEGKASNCKVLGLTFVSADRRGCWFGGEQVACRNDSFRNAILTAMRYIEENTCIKFTERTHGNRIRFQKGEGCYSSLGMLSPGPQVLSLHERHCMERGTIVHEILHSLGFLHVHSRPDRDQYITVHQHNIITEKIDNFAIRANIDTEGVPYDIESILHAGPEAFSSNGERTVTANDGRTYLLGQRKGMTYNDRLLVNRAYGCPDPPKPVPPEAGIKEIKKWDF